MLISIHDSTLRRAAFIDNDKPDTLHYYNDTWHRYLAEATSTFDFTVPKTGSAALRYLTEKNYVSFQYDGADYLFNIMKTEETETELTCYCENLNLELLNETDPAHESDGAKTFAEYMTLCGIHFAQLKMGVNEIADRSRTLSWEGTATKLERLLSVVRQFDAECEFVTVLARDGTVDKIVLNVYKEHDESNQGVGCRRTDRTLYYGKSVSEIRRTVDKTELYTAIQPIGHEGLTIRELEKTYTDAGGMTFVTAAGDPHILCPSMMQEYPSQVFDSTGDRYINLDWEYDTENAETLYSKGLAKLKTVCTPAVTYEVAGQLELDIGDTVTIQDDKFTPMLILEARVSEQEVSFSDPTKNKNTFSNFKALENKTSESINTNLEDAIKAAQPYTAEILSDGGVTFIDGEGSTNLSVRVLKGADNVTASAVTKWYLYDTLLSSENQITVHAADISDSAVCRCDVLDASGVLLCSAQVTLQNLSVGSDVYAGDIYGQITSNQLADGSVNGDKLQSGSVNADKIADGAVDSDKINVDKLSDMTDDLGVCKAGIIESPDGALRIDLNDEKNIKVTSNAKNTTLYIDADGTRVVSNRTNDVVAQFTEAGTETESMTAVIAAIAGIRITEHGDETWISRG